MKCNYCEQQAQWVENKEIYGRNYGKSYMIWLCKQCDAYVGCHNNTKKSLGTLANKELRERRKKIKNLFIEKFMGGNWKDSNGKKKGYVWLNNLFGRDYHFGESTLEELQVIENSL